MKLCDKNQQIFRPDLKLSFWIWIQNYCLISNQIKTKWKIIIPRFKFIHFIIQIYVLDLAPKIRNFEMFKTNVDIRQIWSKVDCAAQSLIFVFCSYLSLAPYFGFPNWVSVWGPTLLFELKDLGTKWII